VERGPAGNRLTAIPEVQSTMLGELLEHAQIAAIVTDDEGRYLAVNRYACDLVGYGREELLGRRVGDLNPASELATHLEQVLGGERSEGELVVQRKDGGDLRVHYRAAKTTLARLPFTVAFFWPVQPSRL
jgi:PAS domain S-box-containing protein